MKKAIFLLAAATTFGLLPFAGRLGPLAGAGLFLLLGVAVAVAASGGFYAMAVASGAIGAFAGGVLVDVSPAIAGACVVGLAFAERTVRVRGGVARLAHMGAAVVGGALSGLLASAYASSSPAVRCVSIVVAAVLTAMPLFVEADDAVAHALDGAAKEVSEPARTALKEGADLRRNAEEALLDAETRRGVGRTWRSLLRLAEARVRLQRSRSLGQVGPRVEGTAPDAPKSPAAAVLQMVDQRIKDHVTALARAYTAVDTAHAAGIGLDDVALRNVDAVGESLEDVSRAIVEVKG